MLQFMRFGRGILVLMVVMPCVSFGADEGASITGRILDKKGKPIAGAQIRAGHHWHNADVIVGNGTDVSCISDENGSYALRGLLFSKVDARDAGGRNIYDMHVKAAGYARACCWVTMPNDQPVAGLDFVLEPEAVLEGRVVDTRGEPISGAKFYFEPAFQRSFSDGTPMPDFMFSSQEDLKTDEAGRFTVGGIPEGTYIFMLRSESQVNPRIKSLNEPVKLTAGAKTEGINFVITASEDRGRIEGSLVGDRGEPVPYTFVQVTKLIRKDGVDGVRGELKTEGLEPGKFVVEGIEPGMATVQVNAPGHPQTNLDVEVPAGESKAITIRLETAAVIEGTVTPPGAAQARVYMHLPERRGVSSATVRQDGSYRFEDVRPGEVVLTAICDVDSSYAHRQQSARITLEPGTTIRADFDLGGTGVVQGTLRVPKGCKAQVVLRGLVEPDPPPWQDSQLLREQMVADFFALQEGSYALRGLPAGSYKLNASSFTSDTATRARTIVREIARNVTLQDDEVLEIDLDLESGP